MSLKNHILYFHRVDFPREKLLLPLYSSAHCAFTFINSFDGIGPGKSLSGWRISTGWTYNWKFPRGGFMELWTSTSLTFVHSMYGRCGNIKGPILLFSTKAQNTP